MADNVIITGALELVAQSDGSQFVPNMKVVGVASQSYTEDGKYFPDWEENASSRPTFTPEVYNAMIGSNSPMKWMHTDKPNTGGLQTWKYNRVVITWVAKQGEEGKYVSASPHVAQDSSPLFELNWSNPKTPALTIVNNIPASLSAADNDYIEFVGYVSSGESSYPITMGKEVKINPLSGGTPFKIDIALGNGNSFDGDSQTNDALYVDVIALLGNDGSVQADANHVPGIEATGAHSGIYKLRAIMDGNTQLYAVDISQSVGIDRYYYNTESGQAQMIAQNRCPTGGFFIKADDVGGECILVLSLIDLKANPNKVLSTASEKISDLGDPDVITFSPKCTKDGNERDTAREVLIGETVTVIVKVMTRNNGADVSSMYSFSDFGVRQSGGTADITSDVVTSAWEIENHHGKWGTTYDKIKKYGAILASVRATKN